MNVQRRPLPWVWVTTGLLVAAPQMIAVAGVCGTAGDELAAARAGLDREWIVQVPLDSAASRLEHVTVGDDLVVAVSGDGGVHAIRSGTAAVGTPWPGSVLWSRSVGRPRGAIEAAGIGGGIVTVASDLGLEAFAAPTGETVWTRGFGTTPAAAAVPVDRWVYVPLTTGGVMRLPVNPYARPEVAEPKPGGKKGGAAKAAADRGDAPPTEKLDPLALDPGGRIEAAPIAYGKGVLWTTDEGLIVALVPTSMGWERMEFDLRTRASGPLFVRDEAIFAATVGGDLARIDREAKGVDGLRVGWHVPLPAAASGGPFVSGDTVVVALGPDGLAAYSAKSGMPLWRSAAVGRIVAIASGRIWLLDELGSLSALDLATGALDGRLCLGSFTVPVVNTTSERIDWPRPAVSSCRSRPAARPSSSSPLALHRLPTRRRRMRSPPSPAPGMPRPKVNPSRRRPARRSRRCRGDHI